MKHPVIPEFEHKAFPLEIKSVDLEESTFDGNSAGIGNLDSYDDIIEPGAFKKTLRERLRSGFVKLLNGHNSQSTENVWGRAIEAEERPWEGKSIKGAEPPTHTLWTKFAISKADPNAQVALRKVAEGHLDALSIGFKPIRVEFEPKDGDEFPDGVDPVWEWFSGRAIRRIKELAWWETSLVTWGANVYAQVIPGTVKSLLHQIESASAKGSEFGHEELMQVLVAIKALLQDDVAAQAILRDIEGSKFGDQLDLVAESATISDCDRALVTEMFDEFKERTKDAQPATFVHYLNRVAEAATEDEGEPVLEGKPYPNEHACRLKDPSAFKAGSFRRKSRKHEGKTYYVIFGRLKGETTLTEQAYRYPKSKWEASEARSHCKSHGGSFEAAAKDDQQRAADDGGTGAGMTATPAATEGQHSEDQVDYDAALAVLSLIGREHGDK